MLQYLNTGIISAIVMGGLFGVVVGGGVMFVEVRFRLFVLDRIRARREEEYAEYLADLQKIDALLPVCIEDAQAQVLVQQCYNDRVARMEKYSDAQVCDIKELEFLEVATLFDLCVRYREWWKQFWGHLLPVSIFR